MATENVGGASEQLVHLAHQIETLKQELIVQGEQLDSEVLSRKAEVGRLKIEIQTLKKLLDELQPGFMAKYDKLYSNERQSFDPELENSA
ncbi:MAG: hypothetical protein ACJ763_18160 [Bdellovibrionia bacterium]